MKFKIGQGEFSRALVSVNKSLLVKVNLPILANILISASGDRVELVSTNLETATKVVVSAAVAVEGRVTIPGKLLLEFVSQIGEGEVVFEKLGEEAVVSTKMYSARFATQPVEEFPAIPKIEKGQSISFKTEDMMRAINRVAFCAALDEGRPILTGVLWELSKGSISMIATDGYRLSFERIDVSGGLTVKIIIPAKSLLEVAKLIAEAEGPKTEGFSMVIAENLNQVNFKIGNVEFTSRLIEGEFPNWQKLIPTAFSSKAKLNREDFIKVIRVAAIFARDAGSIVRLNLEANGSKGAIMKIAASSSQIGSNEASSEIELSGKGGEIAFNFRYLLEMLSSINSDEVEFEMIESLNPGKLTVPDDADYFHIVMPVRLQS